MTLQQQEKEIEAEQESKVRKEVRARYKTLAESQGCNCCGDEGGGRESNVTMLDVPEEAAAVNASCGSPLSLIRPKSGDVVLDLGSGGGIDVFRASKLIGEKGRAIGVDATPEMIWRARDTARKHGYANVEFRLGEIEALPVEAESVDYVISNCVINLSPDKERVFREAYRVLRKDGVFAVADITSEREVPAQVKEDMKIWSSCVSGAITTDNYEELLRSVGFKDVKIKPGGESGDSACCTNESTGVERAYGIKSSHIIAMKEKR